MLVWLCHRRLSDVWGTAKSNAFVLFSLSVSVVIILGLVFYRVAVGSMAEPSHLGGAIKVATSIIRCTFTRFHFSLTCA